MERRTFLARILHLAGLAAVPSVGVASASAMSARAESSEPLLLQTSPVAGFQYHQGETLWPEIQEGCVLTLTREPDNRHDQRAIRIEWQGKKLGYVPRIDNAALASLMDRDHMLVARVNAKRESLDPWQRLELDVYLVR
jgi:hypothetical protein